MTNHEHLPTEKRKTKSTLDSLVLLDDLYRVGGDVGWEGWVGVLEFLECESSFIHVWI